jgi:hypothetical protein
MNEWLRKKDDDADEGKFIMKVYDPLPRYFDRRQEPRSDPATIATLWAIAAALAIVGIIVGLA